MVVANSSEESMCLLTCHDDEPPQEGVVTDTIRSISAVGSEDVDRLNVSSFE